MTPLDLARLRRAIWNGLIYLQTFHVSDVFYLINFFHKKLIMSGVLKYFDIGDVKGL